MIEKFRLRLESGEGALTALSTRNTNHALQLHDLIKHERQKHNMIYDFCKDSISEVNKTLPPSPYLKQVANGPHAALSTYIKLWESKNNENNFCVIQDQIPEVLNIKTQKFMADLIDLCNEKLLSWCKKRKNNKVYIQIELVGWL